MIRRIQRAAVACTIALVFLVPVAQADDGTDAIGWIAGLFDQVVEWVTGRADENLHRPPKADPPGQNDGPATKNDGGDPGCEAGPIVDPNQPECGG